MLISVYQMLLFFLVLAAITGIILFMVRGFRAASLERHYYGQSSNILLNGVWLKCRTLATLRALTLSLGSGSSRTSQTLVAVLGSVQPIMPAW
jgi:hypothetical protein